MTGPYHMGRSEELAFPHSGSLDGARFTMVAARHHVRLRFGRLLASLGFKMRWGFDTPREAYGSIRPAHPDADADLERSTRKVEQIWYACERADVEAAHEADRVLDSLSDGAET